MPVTEASHRERGQSLPADVIEVVVRDCLDLRHCLETLFRFEALDGMMRLGRFLPGRSLRMNRAGGGRCGGRAKRPQPEIGESDKPQLGGEGEVSELMQSMRIGLIDLRDSLRAMGRPMRVVAVNSSRSKRDLCRKTIHLHLLIDTRFLESRDREHFW
jgi:hypothetical protein